MSKLPSFKFDIGHHVRIAGSAAILPWVITDRFLYQYGRSPMYSLERFDRYGKLQTTEAFDHVVESAYPTLSQEIAPLVTFIPGDHLTVGEVKRYVKKKITSFFGMN